MKGIVFCTLEDLIIEKFGDSIMEDLYDEIEFLSDAPPFIGPGTYPDSDLFLLVTALSEKTSIPANDLIFEFGKFMFPALINGFPTFIKGFTEPLAFLKTVDGIIHVEVRKLFQDAVPPKLEVEEIDSRSAILHYRSERKLCRLMEGLLVGLASYFGQQIDFEHLQCMKNGAHECILKIQFSG